MYKYDMKHHCFQEYVQMREGLLLPDKPSVQGFSRLNPFPSFQRRLKRLLAGRRTSRPPRADIPFTPFASRRTDPS
jgi:hypothetical protein